MDRQDTPATGQYPYPDAARSQFAKALSDLYDALRPHYRAQAPGPGSEKRAKEEIQRIVQEYLQAVGYEM